MSITVSNLIKDALQEIGVIRSTQTISAEQLADGIRKLNRLMADWEADGIELGYYPQDSGTDTVPISDENEWPVIVNLAAVLAGEYGAPLTQSTMSEAMRTKRRLEKNTVSIVEMDFDHLPYGMGGTSNIRTGEV